MHALKIRAGIHKVRLLSCMCSHGEASEAGRQTRPDRDLKSGDDLPKDSIHSMLDTFVNNNERSESLAAGMNVVPVRGYTGPHLSPGAPHSGGKQVDAEAVQPEQLRPLQALQGDAQRKGSDAQHILRALPVLVLHDGRRAVPQRVRVCCLHVSALVTPAVP